MRSLVRSSLLACAIALAPAAAWAQADTNAEAHFSRGVALYKEGDFRSAVVEFRRAYELARSWKLLYNVAQAEYQVHDYVAALGSFERYLKEGGAEIPKARRAEVEREIAKLAARVGKLTVNADVEGASVTLDGEALGTAPVVRTVALGDHRIEVTREGHTPWSKTISVAGGDALTLDAVLPPAPVTLPPPPPPPPPPKEADARRVPWEMWTVTGVLAAGAVTTGLVALGAKSDLDAAKNRFDVTDAEIDHDASRVTTFAVITDVLIVATLVVGGVSLYFTLKSPPPPTNAGIELAPGGLRGRF